MRSYIAAISDGHSFDGGGTTTIKASCLATARRRAEAWAEEGDWAGDCVVLLTLRRSGKIVARWHYIIVI